MREKCITQHELLHRGIDNRTLDTLRKNGNMTLYTLEKICKALDCNPEEVVEFTDDEDKMNLDLRQVDGAILSISQFTLYADCHKGNRPSFSNAGKPDHANKLYILQRVYETTWGYSGRRYFRSGYESYIIK